MSKKYRLSLFFTILALLLSACGGFDVGGFEDAFKKALEEKDAIGGLNKYMCPEETFPQEAPRWAHEFDNVKVDCDVDDNKLSCDVKYETENTITTWDVTATINDDGQVCDWDGEFQTRNKE